MGHQVHWCLALMAIITFGDASGDDLRLLVLHNNDMHARFEETSKVSGKCPLLNSDQCVGGFARVAHVVRSARAKAQSGDGPHVLYLNAGDTYTGTAWFGIHRWKIVSEFLNILKPDAMSLGNHEFDDGVTGLFPMINAVSFPVVTANLDLSKEPQLAETHLQPSVILNVASRKIGIIGYLTPDTKIISQTDEVIFLDEVESINKESKKLKKEGVKTIIALGHSGFEMDKTIAKECPLVDVVVGGHTNTFLYNGKQPDIENPEGLYPTVVIQDSGKKVPVVQAYAYTKYMGRLSLVIDSKGKVKSFDGQPLLLNSQVQQDDDVLKVLEKYRPEVNALDKQVVGKTRVLLDGAATSCRGNECNFGNLIADAFVAYRSNLYPGTYWTDTAIAIQNSGGIRNTIDASHKQGNVTRGDLLSVLPFDNRLYGISLNGSDLLEMLEWSVHSNGETSHGEFLQYSGIHVLYDLSKPVGQRLVSASARCAACTIPIYEEIRPDKEYRLMVTSFLINGGDGHTTLKDKSFKKYIEDLNDIDVVAWYFKQNQVLFPEVQGRIKFVGGNRRQVSSAPNKSLKTWLLILVSAIVAFVRLF